MKQLLSAISGLLICIYASAGDVPAIGTDLTETLLTGTFNISAGYSFSDRWSASWRAVINTSQFRTGRSQEEEDHMSEFSPEENDIHILSTSSISVHYWMDQAYEGTFLTAGVKYMTDEKTADYTIGIGYCIPLWKGLRMVLAYESDILSSFRNRTAEGRGLTIGICWTIKNRRK